MAGPWEQFTPQLPVPAEPTGPWSQFKPQPEAAPTTVYSGSILPLSKDSAGNIHFDSNAGIVGSIKRAFTLPHDVMTGQVDPTSDEGVGRALEMAGVATPVNPAVRLGDAAIPGVINAVRKPEAPSADVLRQAASTGYDKARNMGVDYSSEGVKKLAGSIRSDLEQDGILAELAPKSHTILLKLSQAPEGSVAPLAGLEAARRALGNAAKDFNNPTEQLAASRIRGQLDKFMEQPSAENVVAGPAAAAAQTLKDARGNYATASRSDNLTGLQDAAELRGAVANSGQNTGNAIRQRIASLLLKPKEAAGYSPSELKSLEGIARGSLGANASRFAGNLMGGGGGLGMAVSGGLASAPGVAAGSAPMAALGAVGIPLAGMAAKRTSRFLTERALRLADEAIRTRSPLYQSMLAEGQGKVIDPAKRALLVRELLAQEGNEASN